MEHPGPVLLPVARAVRVPPSSCTQCPSALLMVRGLRVPRCLDSCETLPGWEADRGGAWLWSEWPALAVWLSGPQPQSGSHSSHWDPEARVSHTHFSSSEAGVNLEGPDRKG